MCIELLNLGIGIINQLAQQQQQQQQQHVKTYQPSVPRPLEKRKDLFILGPEWCKKMERLMNKSILDVAYLGRGRDAICTEPFTHFKVTNVLRLFNKDKYDAYRCKRRKIQGTGPRPLGFKVDSEAKWMMHIGDPLNRGANEFYFFHGTSPSNAKNILAHNFDRHRASASGALGKGIYFAENADKSDQYSGQGKTMILARVTLGRPFITHESDSALTALVATKLFSKIYDSTVARSQRKTDENGSFHRHQEFVVYDSSQIFTEFLIRYERRK